MIIKIGVVCQRFDGAGRGNTQHANFYPVLLDLGYDPIWFGIMMYLPDRMV